jgi:hypothetical protein
MAFDAFWSARIDCSSMVDDCGKGHWGPSKLNCGCPGFLRLFCLRDNRRGANHGKAGQCVSTLSRRYPPMA